MAEMRPGRFGDEAVIKIVQKGDKFPKGYVTIKNQLYKVTASQGKKEDKNGNPILYWVNIQHVGAANNSSMRGRSNTSSYRR